MPLRGSFQSHPFYAWTMDSPFEQLFFRSACNFYYFKLKYKELSWSKNFGAKKRIFGIFRKLQVCQILKMQMHSFPYFHSKNLYFYELTCFTLKNMVKRMLHQNDPS